MKRPLQIASRVGVAVGGNRSFDRQAEERVVSSTVAPPSTSGSSMKAGLARCLKAHDARPSSQDFFPGGIMVWPLLLNDCLYAETEPFGLSAFGFFASLLPLT